MVTKRALLAAGVAAVPLPGLDLVSDIGALVSLIGRINAAFGLAPEQVARLDAQRRVAVYKAATLAGGSFVGKAVTRQLVLTALKTVGVRLTATQAARVVPLAGQVASAALTFAALKLVCDAHIRACAQVASQLKLPRPVASD